MTKIINLDNGTTTRPSDQAVAEMMPYLIDMWGAPLSPHQMGSALESALEKGYKSIYELLGAKESDTILFTSSGAEAINHVFLSCYQDITISTGKNQFVTTNIEEAPFLMSISRLEQMGCVGKMVEMNRMGKITADQVADVITPRTALVSLSWANGLTGLVQPVSEIARLCQERGIKLHLDATHVLGKVYFDLDDIGADFISFNGDHLHAPKGTGGLYIRGGTALSPFITGGMEQGGYRAGSLNVAGLAALGRAAAQMLDARDLVCTEAARLRNKLETGIMEGFPDAIPFFRQEKRLPNCTTIAFPGVANEALLYALNRKGVLASIGGGSFQQIGLILQACGVDEKLSQTAVSFNLSRETTEDEIDKAIGIITESAKSLRKLSVRLC